MCQRDWMKFDSELLSFAIKTIGLEIVALYCVYNFKICLFAREFLKPEL